MNSPKRHRHARIAAVLLILYWIVLFIGTHIPSVGGTPKIRFPDKTAHMVGYTALAFLLAVAISRRRRITPALYVLLFGAGAIYGAIDEGTQMLVPGRHADVVDWLADIVGVITGLITFGSLRAIIHARRRALPPEPPVSEPNERAWRTANERAVVQMSEPWCK